MFENNESSNINEFGEFGLIDHLTKSFEITQSTTLLGIGDDAAVIKPENQHLVVSTDLLVEGIHFDMMYTPLKHLGYKAVIVNLSDIYAMNAVPEQITFSMGISSKYTVDALEELYQGVKLACELYRVDLVGGDTTSVPSGLTLSVTAIGRAAEEEITYRKGAKPNDLICVSGDLGGAFVGLQILEREKSVFEENDKIQPDLTGHDYVIERILKPEARGDVIKMLSEKDIMPTSMIDISDGLASELHHICKQSKVGCSIYDDKIPIDSTTYNSAMELNLDPLTCALNGGEDYELLFTVKLEDFDKIKGETGISIIGHITEEADGLNLQTQGGGMVSIQAQGWNHFKDD